MVPPDVIDKMTQGYRSIVIGVQGARGLSQFCSRQRNPPPCDVLNDVSGGSYAPKNNLILVDQDCP